MDCEAATPLIEALCDDELDVASVAPLVAHLEMCDACGALRRDVETRKSALREARPLDCLPDEVRSRLAREVGRTAPHRPRPAWAHPLGFTVIGLLAGGIAAGVALRHVPAGPLRIADAPVVSSLEGEVFCLRCALARLFPDTPVLDERHLPVLRTAEGRIITLLDGSVTEAALQRKGCAGRRVELTVRLFPGQDLAEVLAVRELGPGTGPSPRDVLAAAHPRSSPR